MIGVEYMLLHVQDPILYVIRKQHRHSPTEATPMADYYIIAGTIYQAPDLASVFNSRLVSIHQKKIIIFSPRDFQLYFVISIHYFNSYQQFIICKAHSRKPVHIQDITLTKVIHGTLPPIKHVINEIIIIVPF